MQSIKNRSFWMACVTGRTRHVSASNKGGLKTSVLFIFGLVHGALFCSILTWIRFLSVKGV